LFTSRRVSILTNVTTTTKKKPEKLPNDGLTICIEMYYGNNVREDGKVGNVKRFKRGWKPEIQISVKARDTILSKIFQIGPGIHTASYLMGVGILSLEQSGRGVKLAIHFYALPKFRFSGTVFHSSCMPSCLRQRRSYILPSILLPI
jgi:hypothetical protein